MELTKEIIQRCHDLNYNDLSDDIIDRTKYLLLDYIGVAARGSLSDSSIPLLRLVQDLDKTAEGAVVIGTNIRVSPPLAALANGTAAHSL
ncbi:MAG: MmgE/PrpD family protein, partial [Deltaproteobacteria bacterium]|nr:MmgE/PrpD family protein [Deltaproteobacteria bacterium]